MKCKAYKKLKQYVFLLRCVEAGRYMQDKTDRDLVDKNSVHKIWIKQSQNFNKTDTKFEQNRLKPTEIDLTRLKLAEID